MRSIIIFAALAAAAPDVSAQPIPARLSLSQVLELVDRANPEIQAARLKALETGAGAAALRSTMGPQINASAAQSYQTNNLSGLGLLFPGVPSRVGPYRVFDLRPQLSQTVLDLALWANVRAERLRAQADSADADAAAEKLRLTVTELYIQALQADSRRRSAEARVTNAESLLRQSEDLNRAGTGNRLDVARSLEQLERERISVVNAARDRDAALTVLMSALGSESGTLPELEPLKTVPSGVEYTLADALKLRAELRAQHLRRQGYEQERQAVARQRYPRIQAQGDFGVLGQDPSHNVSTYSAGVSVSVPVWTNGRISNEIQAASWKLKRQDQELRQVRLTIARELQQACIERDAARQAAELSANAASAARDALELAKLRFAAGLTTQLDVVTAQANLAQAEEDEIRTRYDGLIAEARLAQAGGDVRRFAHDR